MRTRCRVSRTFDYASWRVVTALLLIGIGAGGQAAAQGDGQRRLSLEELRQMRRQLVQQPRRIIANNDGCDCLYFPKDEQVTVSNFLDKRTTDLAGTHVDAIAYCTISSGFSHFTHDTRVGTLLERQGADYGILPEMRNIAPDLVKGGTDCLRAVIAFGHRQGQEVFWSMRMNDTHDVAHTPAKPYFLFPPLKDQHPEWLVGDWSRRTPYGRWSSVDYARPEIRDLAYRYIEEVCSGYDVDGIELDFFRHLCYFKDVAQGGKATEKQRQVMTELLRRVRQMTEDVGCRRRRPILVSVRVPDSVEYCRDMGLDLERWLEQGLVDMLVTTGYFRLNPWRYSVQLGKRYGVAVYPCLSDSRVRGESRFRRSSLASYRGRAMNAWASGADGVHLFNYFNPKAALWRELGEVETLRTLDKLYFVTVRDGDPNRFLADGAQYRAEPLLTPSRPVPLPLGQPWRTHLTVGDDIQAAVADGHTPSVTLHLEVPLIAAPPHLHVELNEIALTALQAEDGWIDYAVPIDAVRRGQNELIVTLLERAETEAAARTRSAAVHDAVVQIRYPD